MTMAIDEGVNLEDDDEEDVEDEDEDTLADGGDDNDTGDEVGGGDEEGADGSASESVKPVSSWAQFQELLKDPEVSTAFQETVAQYQTRMAAEAAAAQEAEAFQKLVENEDWEGVGKAVVQRQQVESVKGQVREAVVDEMFRPVYQELLAQPELQNLTAEDRENLHIDKFNGNHAKHVEAVSSFIATKRFEAKVEAEVAKRVEAAVTAEKNKDTAAKAKAPNLAGRSPAAIGVVQPKVTSADLIRDGLRGIIGETNTGDDD